MNSPIHLGAFELLSCVGQGGMGQVWDAIHVHEAMPAAIKIFSHSSMDERLLAAFQSEIRAVARLQHPHIVALFDYGEISADVAERMEGEVAAGSPYLVMERLSGGTLASRSPARSWSDYVSIANTILDALAHAHARGVLHRDITMSNVMFGGCEDWRPGLKLIDFGLVRDREQGGELGVGFSAGTPGYAAPEQLAVGGKFEQGPWTDLFAFGSLAFYLACGRAPFEGDSLEATMQACRRGERVAMQADFELPVGFEDWLDELLAYSPKSRFQCAADAADGLRQVDGLTDAGSMQSSRRLAFSLPQIPISWRVPVTEISEPPPKEAGVQLFGLRRPLLTQRVDERDQIWKALLEVERSARAQAVVVRGGAGAGKSSLVEWLVERADETGAATVLKAFHSPVGSALEGLPGMFARYFHCVGLAWSQALVRIQNSLWHAGISDPRRALAMAEVVRPAIVEGKRPSTKRIHFDSPEERYRAMGGVLTHLAGERLVVAWIDDVQWGRDTLHFVQSFLASQDEAPARVLLLVTARAEGNAGGSEQQALLSSLVDRGDVGVLDLGPMARGEMGELLGSLISLEPEVLEAVCVRAGGNPLFALQLVGDWVERRVLELRDGTYALRDGASTSIPDTIQEIWSSRIHTLLEDVGGDEREEAARRALELAACLGHEVEEELWQAVCAQGAVQIPPRLLDKLLKSGLAEATDGGWRFLHPLFRESLERQARDEQRSAAHNRLCGEVLDGGSRLRDFQHLGRVAEHYFKGEAYDEAEARFLEGVDSALACGEFEVADGFLAERVRALDLLEVDAEDGRRVDGWIAEVNRLCTQTHELDEALAICERITTAAKAEGLERQRGYALHYRGVIADHGGEHEEAYGHYCQAFEVLEKVGRDADVALSFYVRARSHYYLGNLDLALELCEQAIEKYRVTGDGFGASRSTDVMAKVYRARGAFDEAIEVTERARRDFERLGYRTWEALAWTTLGEIKRLGRDLDGAELCYERSIDLWQQTGSRKVFYPRLNRAYVHLFRGEFERAQSTFHELMAIAEPWDLGWTIPGLHLGLLGCAAGLSEWDDWHTHFTQIHAHLSQSGTVLDEYALTIELVGDLSHERGRREEAHMAYELAMGQWRGIENHARADALRDKLVLDE